jgi:hypothetical protein
MPPSPSPNPTTIIGPQTNTLAGISTSQSLYLGPNTTLSNDYKTGLTTVLPLKTDNVFTSQKGLNINSSASSGSSALTIDENGNMKTIGQVSATGSITSANSLYVSGTASAGNYNFSVSDTGLTTIQDNLVVGSHYTVTKSSGSLAMDGTLSVGGASSLAGTVTVGNNAVVLGNSGTISAINDVTIGNSAVVLHASSGNAELNGSLNVNSSQLLVDSVNSLVDINCPLNVSGDVNVGSGNFTVESSTGNVVSLGTLSVSNNVSIGGSNVTINSSSGEIDTIGSLNIGSGSIVLDSNDKSIFAQGDLNIGSSLSESVFTVNHTTGFARSSFNAYVPSASASDVDSHINGQGQLVQADDVTPAIVDFTSPTSNYLTTQSYVDQAIFKQTARINSILGVDSSVLNSFNNVYGIVKAIEGSTTASESLTTIANNYGAINTTVSDLAGNALNSVLMNASPAIWADECAPLPIPTSLSTNAMLDGWYFKNLLASSKVNWYLPASSGLTVSDIVNLYANILVVNKTSLPFITIYTKPTGTNDYYPGFANARINYVFNGASLTNNNFYSLYIGANAPENNNQITPMKYTSLEVTNATNRSNPASSLSSIVSPSDQVLCFAINSDSGAAQNNVEFVLNSFNIQRNSLSDPKGAKGTTQYLFQNSAVATNYMFNTLFQKNNDFSAITNKNKNQLAAYNAIYASA